MPSSSVSATPEPARRWRDGVLPNVAPTSDPREVARRYDEPGARVARLPRMTDGQSNDGYPSSDCTSVIWATFRARAAESGWVSHHVAGMVRA